MISETCDICAAPAVRPSGNMQTALCAAHLARVCQCGQYVVPTGAAEFVAPEFEGDPESIMQHHVIGPRCWQPCGDCGEPVAYFEPLGVWCHTEPGRACFLSGPPPEPHRCSDACRGEDYAPCDQCGEHNAAAVLVGDDLLCPTCAASKPVRL